MLNGILVLDLADEQGSYCSKLLADLGGTVIKVEEPNGDPSKSRDSSSFFYTNTNKLGVCIDLKTRDGNRLFRGLLKAADVLVETFPRDCPASLNLGPRRFRRINPSLIHVSITHFGRTGPPGNLLDLPGCQPYSTASLFGAVAALIHLRKRKVTGRGRHVDLSVHEAVASMLEHELADSLQAAPGRPSDEGFSILRSRDGYIQIPIFRCWDTLLELMASEGKALCLHELQWQDPAYREARLDTAITIIEEWTSCFARRELLELGQTLGFPWASVDSIEEAFQNPQLRFRQFFLCASLSAGGPTVSFPGFPCKFSAHSPAPTNPFSSMGEPTLDFLKAIGNTRATSINRVRRCPDERTLEGLRVLDLTRMISGPYATRILADFGAEVVKVQSEKTANGAERNDTPAFSIWNRNKRSIILDLDLQDARSTFLNLVAGSDIVVENFSPRVMKNWGLHYDRLKEVKPDLVMMSMSAMGNTGPWQDFVGFAPTFHALSGLISATSGNLRRPADLGYPYADLIAGLYAVLAILSAIEYKDRTGKGQHIDLSALEAICALLGPAFIKSKVDSDLTVWRQPRAQFSNWVKDPHLTARRFFVSLQHPVLGRVVSSRTALWDWRRKPRWKASPSLGEVIAKKGGASPFPRATPSSSDRGI